MSGNNTWWLMLNKIKGVNTLEELIVYRSCQSKSGQKKLSIKIKDGCLAEHFYNKK